MMSDKGGRIKMYALIVIALALLVGSVFGGKKVYTKLIDKVIESRTAEIHKGYQDTIEALQRSITEKDAALKASEQRYTRLKGKIQAAAAQAEAIKPPATNSEIKKRLKDLGYEVR